MPDLFDSLSSPIRTLLREAGFTQPTPPQVQALPAIMQGKNVLLVSPTGSGKTEAAMIPILDTIIKQSMTSIQGIKAIYITPLRALNRDLLDRLEMWCKKLDIKISVRHGDTSLQERRVQSLSPPDILVTTPETLQVLLVSRRIREFFRPLRWAVIDEVHELASDKRGSQLAVCLERLREVSDIDFQRIGLSATVGSPEVIARFLAGNERECEVVQVKTQKPFEFSVHFPIFGEKDRVDAEKMQTFPDVVARLRLISSLLKEGPSIIFTNTRSEAEILASRLKIWDQDLKLAVHHGSLSRGARSKAEVNLKTGQLATIVSTSSLEMGIDIGRVNLIIQYGSPRQVTRLVQRAGRSGHTLQRKSRCVIITQDSDDALEAAAISKMALEEKFEPVEPFEKPYDVLVQQLAGLLIERRSWKVDDLHRILRRSYPFKELSLAELERTLEFMQSMRPRLASYKDGIASRPYDVRRLFNYYFENLSMIPEIRQYPVVSSDGELVGALDEEFVAKEGEIGKKFILGGSAWRVEQVYNGRVYVRKEEDPTGAIPSWVGEEIPVPLEVAEEVGKLRRDAVKYLSSNEFSNWVSETSARYNIDRSSFLNAMKELREQVDMKMEVPGEDTITLEQWGSIVILTTHWGLRINRTLSRILSKLLSEERRIISGEDAYRVVLEGRGLEIHEVKKTLLKLPYMDITSILKDACEESGFFRIRFMHVARKMGIIERDADLTSSLLQKVMSVYKQGIPFEEAWKTFLQSDVDIRGLSKKLGEIAADRIRIAELGILSRPSPLSEISLEEMSRKGEVMDPSRMKRIALESAKIRASTSNVTLLCTNCWKYLSESYVSEINEVRCPYCNSKAVASSQEDEEMVERLARRMASGMQAPQGWRRILERFRRSASINEKFGVIGVMAQVFRVPAKELERILAKHPYPDDGFYSELLEAERRELLKRFLQ